MPDAVFQFHPSGNDLDRIEDANLPGSLPVLRGHHAVSKADEEDLPARVERIWYINPYGHEILPVANPKVLAAVADSEVVVYSIGSLYTSIIPSLILRGVGAAIRGGVGTEGRKQKKKVLIMNAKVDRETGPVGRPMTAVDFVKAVARAGKESQMEFGEVLDGEVVEYVSDLVYLEEDGVGDDEVAGEKLERVLMPKVDVGALAWLGIRCVKVKGVVAVDGRKRMVRYEERALVEALEGIIG